MSIRKSRIKEALGHFWCKTSVLALTISGMAAICRILSSRGAGDTRPSCGRGPILIRCVQCDCGGVEGFAGEIQHIGSQRYPRFTSAMHSPAADAASLTAWFSIFRQADPSVYAAVARYLLDPDAPLLNTSVEEQSRVWVWLVESVWAPNGAKPMQRVRDTAETRASEDVLWQELQNLWPRLASPTQQALVTLAQQSQA